MLCALNLIGEALVFVLHLPVPGPVIGMALLLFFLILKKGMPQGLEESSNGLLRYLALLFVPAGVGITLHYELIKNEWVAISGAVIGATLLTIAFCALLMKITGKRHE